MLTKVYRKKLEKYEKLTTFFYKFRILFLVVITFIGATVATLMSIKGIVINEIVLQDTEYGKSLYYYCKAIFSNDMYYEFSDANSDSWTKTEPKTPGEYKIRGVSKNIFNKDRPGKAYTFKILPKTAEITLDNTFIYGANDASVGLNFNLEYNDKVIDINYEILSVDENTVNFKLNDNFKIVNSVGDDVTSYYNFNIHESYSGSYQKINITLETKGEIEYDAKEHQGNDVEIISGNLFNNDKLNVINRKSFKNVGRYIDNPEIKITNTQGVDVTNLYRYSYSATSAFKINKRNLEIKVDDYTKTYDGKALLNKEISYSIKSGSLLSGDSLKLYLPSKIDAGTYKEAPTISLLSSDGIDQSSNYQITFEYGTYTIKKRPITVTFEPFSTTYNGYGDVNYNLFYNEKDLVDGHRVAHGHEWKDYVHAGNYSSFDCSVYIYDSELKNEYTKNYDITIKTSSFTVHKYDIKITTGSMNFAYNGKEWSWPIFEIIGEYPETDSFNVKKATTATDVGKYKNVLEFEIVNSMYGDVTNDYNITFDYGILNIMEVHDGGENPDGDIIIDDDGDASLEQNDNYQYDEIGEDENADKVVFRYTPYSAGNVFLISNTGYGNFNGKKGWTAAEDYTSHYGINPQEFIRYLLMDKVKNKYGVIDYYNIKSRNVDLVGNYPYLDRLQENDNQNIISNLKDNYLDVKMLDFEYYEDYEILDGLSQTNEKVKLEEKDYSKFVYQNYFGFGSGYKEKYQKYVDQNSLKDNTVIGLARKIKDLFNKGFKYSATNLEASRRDDPIYSFLTETKIGKCDYFAGAATIFYRLNGFPARMIGGWSISVTNNDVGKNLDVKKKQAHAITQVYLDGKGWVSFDFTIGSSDDEGSGGGSGEIDLSQYDLVITTESDYKVFDDKPLKGKEATLTGNLKEGHKFYTYNTSEITRAGSIVNKPNYAILDKNGNDVSSQYSIFENFGYLIVNKRQLIANTLNESIQYDGKEHISTIRLIGELDGFSCSYNASSFVERGTYDAVALIAEIVKFLDEEKWWEGGYIDYTDCFDVEYDYGVITIY